MKDSTPLKSDSTETILAPVTCLHMSALGVDVHSQILVCHYERYQPESRELLYDAEQFGTSQTELARFASWAKEHEPEIVLMESTGVYWNSPYEALENEGFTQDRLVVVKASTVKAARGRKTDKVDAKRLCQYARMGSFTGSFVPARAVRHARQVGRRYHQATQDCAREANRFHKLFSFTGTRLSSVFSDISGKTATLLINAFLDKPFNEFDELVRKKCSRLKASHAEIVDAFARLDSPILREQMLLQRDIWREAQKVRAKLENLLRKATKPFEWVIRKLTLVPGIKEVSAMKIVSEIGDDLGAFKNIERFCSWNGTCPGNNESAGKRRGSRTPKGSSYLKTYLVEVGQSIGLLRRKLNCQLYRSFQAIKERRGHNRAVVAIAHKVARIIYFLIKNPDVEYKEVTCETLREVRSKRLSNSIRSALEIGLVTNGKEVFDTVTGELIRT